MAYYARVYYPADNDGDANFAVPFQYISQDHVEVLRKLTDEEDYTDTLVSGTDYTWTSAAQVTLTSPRLNTQDILIKRATPADDLLVRVQASTIQAEKINLENLHLLYLEQEALDEGTFLQASVSSLNGRAMRVPRGELIDELPAVAGRAGYFLTFDAEGNPAMAGGTGADGTLRSDLAASSGGLLVGVSGSGFFSSVQGMVTKLLSSTGAQIVGFVMALSGAITRTVQDALRDKPASIRDFGGDGVGDDTAAVTLAEASEATFIDLCGLTVTCTLNGNDLTKNYYNGTLVANNSVSGRYMNVKNRAPVEDYELGRRRTKSPILDWTGLSLLWLGTSIPAYGATDSNSYPHIFAGALGAEVSNWAWPGSHASYAGAAAYASLTTDAERLSHILALSMTEDDRLAGLAAYGASSAYSDSSPIAGINISTPSTMTADARIKAQFAAGEFDAVFLDHCHNDALQPPGTDAPEVLTITGVTKAADTVITVSGIGSVAVGDGIILRVNGIGKLNYHACRVQAVAGSNITISLDSSAFTGTFTGGTVTKVDRNTLWGAFEFVISYTLWAANFYGRPEPKIIMSSPPSAWSDYIRRDQMPYTASVLMDIADLWQFSFFDALYLYDVKLFDQATYLSDGTHPATLPERQSFANHWTAWAQGGEVRTHNPGEFLPAVPGATYTDMREPVYDDFLQAFGTPAYRIGAYMDVLSDDFADGNYTGWTSNGTAPTVVTAPWDAGVKAIKCAGAGANLSYLSRAAALDDVSEGAMDLYLSAVSGIIPSGIQSITLMRLKNGTSGQVATLNLVIQPTSVLVRMEYFTNPDNTGLVVVPGSAVNLEAGRKYHLKMKTLKADTGYEGAVLFYIDDELIASQTGIDTSTQTAPASVEVGIGYKSGSFDAELYFGSPQFGKRVATLSSTRYTGSFSTGSATVTVVNGIITGVA